MNIFKEIEIRANNNLYRYQISYSTGHLSNGNAYTLYRLVLYLNDKRAIGTYETSIKQKAIDSMRRRIDNLLDTLMI